MNAEITGEIPRIDGGQSPALRSLAIPEPHLPPFLLSAALRDRWAGDARAVVSTVTLRRFRS